MTSSDALLTESTRKPNHANLLSDLRATRHSDTGGGGEDRPRCWEPWPLQAPSALKVVVAGSALLEAWQGESACWPLYGGEPTGRAGCEYSCKEDTFQSHDGMLIASRTPAAEATQDWVH